MIERNKINELEKWNVSDGRMPLLMQGARQVGKTCLVKEFGRRFFPKMHYFNFELSRKLGAIFQEDLEVAKLLADLALASGDAINAGDLVFFDEIQECPRALTALKYFCEDMPSLAVIAAGSLLGVSLAEESFPVGKVNHFWLGPCTFAEFLQALGDRPGIELLEEAKSTKQISAFAHQHLWERLKLFYVSGGLPRAVTTFAAHKDNPLVAHQKVREVQGEVLRDYRSDFSKHSEKANAMNIRTVFEHIPEQLCATQDLSTKKFKFANVIRGKKGYAALQTPIAWLEGAGLAYRVSITKKAMLPLKSFCDESVFKLYLFDIGLLGAQAELPTNAIINEDYGIAKGFFAENLALQALKENDLHTPVCWMTR